MELGTKLLFCYSLLVIFYVNFNKQRLYTVFEFLGITVLHTTAPAAAAPWLHCGAAAAPMDVASVAAPPVVAAFVDDASIAAAPVATAPVAAAPMVATSSEASM